VDDGPVAGILGGKAPGVSRTVLGELPESPGYKDRVGKGSGSDEFEAMRLHAVRSDVHKSRVSEYIFFSRK